MRKRVILLLSSIFCISMLTYGIDAWIRINQLGYLPNAQKKAILISESPLQLKQFSIHDALTNQELALFNSIVAKGTWKLYQSTYILDFSSFKIQGAFYIKAGLIYSPTIFINKNTFLGSADFLLNFMRQQRCGTNSSTNETCHQYDGYELTSEEPQKPEPRKKSQEVEPKSKFVGVKGGWHDATDFVKYGMTSASSVYQLLFAYQMNPTAFDDKYDAFGNKVSNGIPDILDEAKWGLDWLLKMNPSKELIYQQVADDRDRAKFRLPFEDSTDYGWGAGAGRPVYIATGKPQGLFGTKNRSTGIASIAGKYSSAFGLGAEIWARFNSSYADSLKSKALEAYAYGKKYPGASQSVPAKEPYFYEEDNWADDMELAATQLYHLTYEGNYLNDAANFGRMEPISPWMCSDTARHYQWYPFINLGHFMMANVENPRYQTEFSQNMLNGIQRMQVFANSNPFNIGIPFIRCSNNMVVALATQCRLYRTLTNDSTYLDMETSLVDWLFGRNPWGTSMIVGLPKIGDAPREPYSFQNQNNQKLPNGGLINGAVQPKIFKNLTGNQLSKEDKYERFQSSWAVYHDDISDFVTNQPTLDGTSSLSYLLASKQQEGVSDKTSDNNLYTFGGITRTSANKKQISLVFSGNETADGYRIIRKTLKKLNVKASFFFTGDFYRKPKFRHIIKGLKEDNHYLGAHSDKHLLYCSWQNRDSLLVTKAQFLNDIKANYAEMEKFGIHKNQTPFFLPPFEWYNENISLWSKEIGIQLVNFTPGTLSNADYSIPEMRDKYYSTNEIYQKILQVEKKQGLNGNILLFHIGTDKRRQDKFYPRLYSLIIDLSKAGYDFVDLYQATDVVGENEILTDKKQKRKN